MKQLSVVITLGIIQIIILSLFGLYFYQLKHPSPLNKIPATSEKNSLQEGLTP